MNWTIRTATADDAEALALVGAATFLETFAPVHTGAEIVDHCREEHSAEAYCRLIGPTSDAWLVETAATAAPVGYALLTAAELPCAAPEDLELKRIYVLSRLHGGGAGAALMRLAVARARERRAARLLLSVYSENDRALAFYRKQGFAKVGDHRFCVGATGYLDFVLALPLA
ncbi:MAG: GNAT family N-acetyltransferase [Elsteraceae bacterium]